MFNIHSVTLINFRSYKGTHKFEFPTVNGLYYLTGKNLLEPALGANGAGKSTFLDAITWVLYGRTTRGLKATDILTWHAKVGAQVIIDLSIGEQRYTIKRTQKPNNLFIDDKPVDQKELETFIRLNYAAFTHTVINPQFGTSFFSLSASDKLTPFSDFMKLDFWLIKADEATKLARQQEAAVLKLRNDITRNEGQLTVIKDDIARLREQAASYEKKRDVELSKFEDDSSKLSEEVASLTKAVKKLENHITILTEEELDALARQVTNCEDIRDRYITNVQVLAADKQREKDDIRDVEKAIERLKALGSGSCPHCEQPIQPKQIGTAIAFYHDEIERSKNEIKSIEIVHQRRMLDLVKAKNELARCESKYQEVEDAINAAKADLGRKSDRAKTISNLLGSVRQQIDRLERDINPFQPTLVNKRKDEINTYGTLNESRKLLDDLEADLEASFYWAKGFKRLRLLIIEEAFQTLELEVNNCLAQLGMTDWQVSFDIERENKSGGITKGFVVMIKSPANSEPVKWENWSGGETQRLQLAGDLGLSNLIMQQAGLRSEIEFYDEPSTHLSPEGMMDLADTLHDRAVSEGKRIWIADHATIASFGDFEGIITARKDENGSSIASE